MTSLREQLWATKKRMKRSTPWLFAQWHELQRARWAKEQADERLQRAHKAWDDL